MTQTINNTHVGPVNFAGGSCLRKVNTAGTKTYEAKYPRIGRSHSAFRGKYAGWNLSAEGWFTEQCQPIGSLHAARFLCGGYPK